jgi:hypothetical protein
MFLVFTFNRRFSIALIRIGIIIVDALLCIHNLLNSACVKTLQGWRINETIVKLHIKNFRH